MVVRESLQQLVEKLFKIDLKSQEIVLFSASVFGSEDSLKRYSDACQWGPQHDHAFEKD
ncbi:hypothetical protein KOR42_33820 [Thalassoglobus neptunius]|uniref:Uncharacterized protein n=1 Tax=Thalassoglobus neptunius TaxID=1938619 RepID=A0A5C5WLN2_9PLAN|nr:hypothetical protein [Thalassoglobus neptunius]TWT51696.1 hypothetical protein KOR42_33820 [Thalassoglobus neptunius]